MPYRSNVDEQVVKMSFDNSNFDSNVNDSIKTLNSLDNKLASLNNANFSGLNSGMESLANFLTVKGQVMFGVLTRLGSEVVNFGIKAKNALFGGIRDGLGEYNTIIDSTQTIYQNVKQSGATLQNVNDALDELNDYADKTIYNFGQMTNMIGRFTSAGVGLSKSVSTIKGLANAAALVGANTEKAQMAWNAVSKAMSKGSFDLLTWKTLEYSNIAGEQFKNVITEAARANKVTGKSGQNIDQMLAKYGDLGHTLQEGWLTRDLFNEAMQILSGALSDEELKAKGYTTSQIEKLRSIADAAEEAATKVKTFRQLMDTLGEAVGSGWAQSFRILVGDLEQAKDLYTRISDVISNFIDNNAKIRNNLFKQIMDDDDKKRWESNFTSGRESFRKIIENMMATVKTFLKAVKTGFLNIFPIERIRDAARKVLDTVQKFTRALVINNEEIKESTDGDKILGWDTEHIQAISEAVKDLIRFFRGLASAVDIAWMAISQPIKAIIERIPFFQNFFEKTNGGIIGLLKNLGKFGDKITVIRNAFKNTNFFGEVVGYLIDNIDELGKRYPVLGAILWIFKTIKNVFTGVKDVFKSMNIKPLATLFGVIKFIAEAVWKILNFIFSIFKSIKDSIDWSFLDGPKKALISFLQKLSDYGQGLISFEELTGKIGAKLKEIFSKLLSVFDKSNKASDKVTKSAGKIQKAAEKTGSVLSSIWNKIKTFFGSIGSFFKKVFEGADFSFEGIIKKVALLGGGIAAAMLAVSHFSKTLAKISILKNINNLLLAGVHVVRAYERQIQSKMILNIAISIGILAAAMVGLAFVPYDKLENGLVVFSSFLAVLAVTLTPIITALAKFNESIGIARKQLSQYDVLNNLVTQIGKVGKKLARGFEFRMIGKMFKDVAISILIFVGALTALVFLFKYEEKNLIKSATLIAAMIGAITIAVMLLIAVMERTSKVTKNTKATIGTFASFFKLSGVAKVILAISASVLVLAFTMRMMAKLDPERLNTSFGYVMGLVGLLGTIAVGVAYFTSKAKDIGKLKKISVSMFGAMAGVAVVLLAMKPLIESLISDNDGKAWSRALIIFATVMTTFTAMIAVLMKMAKKIGGGDKNNLVIWQNLEKFSLIMVAAITAIAGVLFVISKMGDIPKNTMITIGIVGGVLVAFISLLALTTIVISQCKKTFSSNFALVVEKISFSIAAVVAAIGILAAGIGALIAALSSMNVPDTDVKKVQTNLLNKLSMIANIITDALPKLRKALYQIGWSVGSMFVSFIVGFSDSIISSGETMLSIADKFVNLIIDLLDKVVNILYSRRYDIARIIRKALDLIFAEITAVLNSFFKKKDGTGVFTEDGIAKILGIGAATVGGFKLFGKLADGFNKVTLTINNLKKTFPGLSKAFKECSAIMSTDEMSFGNKVKLVNNLLITKISNLKGIKAAGNGVAKILSKISGQEIKFDPNAPVSLKKTAIALAAVAAAAITVKLTFEAMSQMSGKTAQKIRTDVNDFTDILTDSTALWQSIIYGFVSVVTTIVTYLFYPITSVIALVTERMAQILRQYADLYELIDKDKADKLKAKVEEYESIVAGINAANDKPWDIESQFPDNYEIQNLSEEAYNDGKYISDNFTAGAEEGLSSFGSMLNECLTVESKEAVENLKDYFQINSPSKLMRDIYRYVMMGALDGLELEGPSLINYLKNVSDTVTKISTEGAVAASKAWSETLSAMGYTTQEIDDLLNEGRFRKYRFEIEDQATGQIKEVELKKEYLELLYQEKDAIKGLSREEAVRNLLIKEGFDLTKLAEEGYKEEHQEEWAQFHQAVIDTVNVVDAALTQQVDKTKVYSQGITDIYDQSILTLQDVTDKAQAATDLAVKDIMNSYAEMGAIAKEHSEEMVGLKEAEVQAFLEQEGIERGMSAKAAADSSRLITATLFKASEANTEISKQELENKLGMYATEYENYVALQKAELVVAANYAAAREEAEKAKGEYDTASVDKGTGYERARWEQSDEAKKLQSRITYWKESEAFWEGKLREVTDEMTATVKDIAYDAGLEGDEFDQFWNSYYDTALNALGKVESNKRGSFKGVLDSFLSMLGINNASKPDLSYWDFNEEVKDSATLTDNDINTAVGAASDLKDGLESQRADLTPTFDLDQLASDAQKANGIVMSSLMAAQNASIGDYINQDSELNPFMKDRWQNVYNFTQNNYSPKALSRIDIYRQTHRQLGMSRGF